METKQEKKESPRTGGGISALKFLPLVVFAALVIVFKLELLLAAPIATFVAILVYIFIYRSNFDIALEQGLKSARSIIGGFFILMFAYAVAESFIATGVGASLINLALKLGVTGRTVAVISLIVTCLLSVATGTSWGTFAACAPIFLWLSELVGGDPILTVCAIAGGSCFGDNIGMISDVTVLSCGMQDVRIIDRVKHQSVWSCSCLVLAAVVIFLCSLHLPNTQGDVAEAISKIPGEAYAALAEERPVALELLSQIEHGVPYYMIIPMVLVIVLSFMGLNTLICLGSGMISAMLLGVIAGTTTFPEWLNNQVLAGFRDAGGSVVIMMLWVSVFGGIMNSMNTFDPLAKFFVKISKNVHQLMGWCGILCLVGNAALADEAAQVVTISPIIRDVVEKNVECEDEKAAYALRVRLATLTSSMGIYGSELIPWHCFPVFFAKIATSVYPLHEFTAIDIISRNYMSFIVIGSIIILSFTGLDRFVPMFGLPDKKRVRLKKETTTPV